jgi:hypothetical protein
MRPDLLATSGDHLRIWAITEDAVVLDRLLANVSDCGAPCLWPLDWAFVGHCAGSIDVRALT